jgi:hypothetical protein
VPALFFVDVTYNSTIEARGAATFLKVLALFRTDALIGNPGRGWSD